MINIIKKLLSSVRTDSLYKNSILLLINNALIALTGFIFWIIAARTYTTDEVGVATALISTTTFLSMVSLFGLNTSLIRLLPVSKFKNHLISFSLFLIAIGSIFAGLIFLVLVEQVSPPLSFLKDHAFSSALTILFIVANGINVITDSIFLANRTAKFTLVANLGLVAFKLGLPLALVGYGGFGLFLAHACGIAASMVISCFLLVRYLNFRPAKAINKIDIRNLSSFSFSNYLLYMFQSAPLMLLPVLIASRAGVSSAAYFYIAMTIASFIYLIPNIITNAMFAESSNNVKEMRSHLSKTTQMLIYILTPAILVTIVFSSAVLSIFGADFSDQSSTILKVLAISGIFMAINFVGITVLRVQYKLKIATIINLLGSLIILLISFFVVQYSLVWVSYVWFFGQALMSLLYIPYILSSMSKR